MNNTLNILQSGKESILEQSRALKTMSELLDESFESAIELISKTNDQIVVTGMGKSAIIGNKMVATFNSTGTPAIFMHAADAIHGDLGMIRKNEVVICISKTGNTPEIKALIPFIKRGNNKIIAITSDPNSYLGTNSDVILNTFIKEEVCPNNLAPTTSTTAQLVMGDALAITLIQLKGFSKEDFAKYHPGGMLGRQLLSKAKDYMIPIDDSGFISKDASIKDVIVNISSGQLGAIVVVDSTKFVLGIITDGDIRRMLEKYDQFHDIKAEDIMSLNPKTISPEQYIVEAMDAMKNYKISHLPVTENKKYKGLVQLQDLVKEGF